MEGGIENLLSPTPINTTADMGCVLWFLIISFLGLLLVVANVSSLFVIGLAVLLLHCVALCCVRSFAFFCAACLFFMRLFVLFVLFASLFVVVVYCVLFLVISKLSMYRPFTTKTTTE